MRVGQPCIFVGGEDFSATENLSWPPGTVYEYVGKTRSDRLGNFKVTRDPYGGKDTKVGDIQRWEYWRMKQYSPPTKAAISRMLLDTQL